MNQPADSPDALAWAKSETKLILDWLVEQTTADRGRTNESEGWSQCLAAAGVNIDCCVYRNEVPPHWLPDAPHEFAWDSKALVLPPLELGPDFVGFLRIVTGRQDPRRHESSVQVSFVYPDHSDEQHPYRQYGFRFESPSPPSPEGRGEHCFFHVQPIRSMRGKKDLEAEPCLPPGADKGPTKPLPIRCADCPERVQIVALLLLAILSIYGRSKWDELVAMLRRENVSNEVSRLIDGMEAYIAWPEL